MRRRALLAVALVVLVGAAVTRLGDHERMDHERRQASSLSEAFGVPPGMRLIDRRVQPYVSEEGDVFLADDPGEGRVLGVGVRHRFAPDGDAPAAAAVDRIVERIDRLGLQPRVREVGRLGEVGRLHVDADNGRHRVAAVVFVPRSGDQALLSLPWSEADVVVVALKPMSSGGATAFAGIMPV